MKRKNYSGSEKYEILKRQFVVYSLHFILMHRKKLPFKSSLVPNSVDWFLMSFQKNQEIMKGLRNFKNQIYMGIFFDEKLIELWEIITNQPTKSKHFNTVLQGYNKSLSFLSNFQILVKVLPSSIKFDKINFRIFTKNKYNLMKYKNYKFPDINMKYGDISVSVWYLNKEQLLNINQLNSSLIEDFLTDDVIQQEEYEILDDEYEENRIPSPIELFQLKKVVTDDNLLESRWIANRKFSEREDQIVSFNDYFKKQKILSSLCDGNKQLKSVKISDVMKRLNELKL